MKYIRMANVNMQNAKDKFDKKIIQDLYVSEVIMKVLLVNTITDDNFIFVLFKLFVNYSMYIYLLHFIKTVWQYNKQVTGL